MKVVKNVERSYYINGFSYGFNTFLVKIIYFAASLTLQIIIYLLIFYNTLG
jgi:hypothetical protein